MQRNRTRGPIAAATLLVLTLIPIGAFGASETNSPTAEDARMARPADGIEYIADRAITRDAKTGALRKPSRQEISDLVRSLKTLINRSPVGLEAKSTADGTARMDLEGRFAMVFLVRPTEEGGDETLCVSTFEEAIEFLGLRAAPTPGDSAKSAQGGQR